MDYICICNTRKCVMYHCISRLLRLTRALFGIIPLPAWLFVSGVFLMDGYESLHDSVCIRHLLIRTMLMHLHKNHSAQPSTTQATLVASSEALVISSAKGSVFSDLVACCRRSCQTNGSWIICINKPNGFQQGSDTKL